MKKGTINISDYNTLSDYLVAVDNKSLIEFYQEMREKTSFGESSIVRKLIDLYHKEYSNGRTQFHLSHIAVTTFTADEIVKRYTKTIF